MDTKISYANRYREVQELFNENKYDECIAVGKQLLCDITLPRFIIIKVCILICFATEDWDEAEEYRKAGEQVFGVARGLITAENTDDETEAGFVLLRKDLDSIAKDQARYIPEQEDDDEEMDVEREVYGEKSEEENEDEAEEEDVMEGELEQQKHDIEEATSGLDVNEEIVAGMNKEMERAAERPTRVNGVSNTESMRNLSLRVRDTNYNAPKG
ncbi:hypothetical protein EJ08DRAFT_680447 [Tothia fuscella]|uniref:Uncharacterized protein n=1 Tax=Tothia fuscella TaxID=1048955 RepID=A0A9P4NNF4_9PEZI|nr:hypothetical protein EJ08DRAFT_680447 [Tothia fuscella]